MGLVNREFAKCPLVYTLYKINTKSILITGLKVVSSLLSKCSLVLMNQYRPCMCVSVCAYI